MIVQNEMQYYAMIKFVESSDFFAYDIESTGVNVRKDTIIGFGVSNHEDKGFYLPLFIWNTETQELDATGFDPLPILNILKDKKLIMHNGSFDIRITQNDLGVDLLDALYGENMLAKHMLYEDGRFALKDTAKEFAYEIGFDAETAANQEQLELKSYLKSIGAGPKEFYKTKLSILGKYCISDCTLTFKLFRFFHEEMKKQNLLEFFYEKEVMPLYKLVTIPMEKNGVRLNMDLLNQYNDEIVISISEYRIKILKMLFEIPETQEVINDMAVKMFPVKKGGAFGQEVAKQYKLDLPLTKSGKFSMTAKALGVLDQGNPAVRFLKGEIDISESKAIEISRKLYEDKMDEPFNLNSRTQMKALMFDKLKFKPLGLTATGQPQFNADFIESIKDDFEWAAELDIYNKLFKTQGTYYQRFLDRNEDGYYFFSYKQHGTTSGRYSSDSQQLPRPKEQGELPDIVLKYNNIIKKLLICEDDTIFIDNDYTSLEPHVFSHITGDRGLIDIFGKGHDFYSTIAIGTEKLTGYSPDKKADNYLGKVNKPLRQSAKAYSLGVPYGMEAYALGKTLDTSTKDAQVKIDDYMDAFPGLHSWMLKSKETAKTKGVITSEAGRVRHLPQVKALYAQHRDNLNKWQYKKALKARVGDLEARRIVLDWKNGLNNAMNFQVQSLSASIMNRSGIAMALEFKRLGLKAQIVAQIHDEYIVECTLDIKQQVSEIMQDCMENTYKLKLKLEAEPEFCKNWDGH